MKWLVALLIAVALAIMIVGTPIALLIECKSALDSYRLRRTVTRRESLGDAEFIETYYKGSSIPPEIPLRLRPIYGQYFQLDPLKIRPEDLPPDLYEFDTQPLVETIQDEFGIKISDNDQERTTGDFDSLVRLIFRLRSSGEDNLQTIQCI